jgi:hypothetical protein
VAGSGAGQIPPPWARWENEALAARAACGSSQARVQPVRLSTSSRRGVRTRCAGCWNSAPDGLKGSTTVRLRQPTHWGAGRAATGPGGPAARDRHGGRDRGRVPGRAAHGAAQDPSEPAHGRAASVRGRGAARASGRAGRSGGLRVHRAAGRPAAGDCVPWPSVAAGANPKEVAARAGHASVSFTLDRHGHLYPEADTALRDRLDVLYGTARPIPSSPVVRLPRRARRGPAWPQAVPKTTRAPRAAIWPARRPARAGARWAWVATERQIGARAGWSGAGTGWRGRSCRSRLNTAGRCGRPHAR